MKSMLCSKEFLRKALSHFAFRNTPLNLLSVSRLIFTVLLVAVGLAEIILSTTEGLALYGTYT